MHAIRTDGHTLVYEGINELLTSYIRFARSVSMALACTRFSIQYLCEVSLQQHTPCIAGSETSMRKHLCNAQSTFIAMHREDCLATWYRPAFPDQQQGSDHGSKSNMMQGTVQSSFCGTAISPQQQLRRPNSYRSRLTLRCQDR